MVLPLGLDPDYDYDFFDMLHWFDLSKFQTSYYISNLTHERWESWINFKILVDIIKRLKDYSLDVKLIEFEECEDKIKIKHKKNFEMVEYLSKKFKFSNLIYDLDELAGMFDEYEIKDDKLKKALKPFIKEVQKIWEIELNKEVEDFIIDGEVKEMWEKAINNELYY